MGSRDMEGLQAQEAGSFQQDGSRVRSAPGTGWSHRSVRSWNSEQARDKSWARRAHKAAWRTVSKGEQPQGQNCGEMPLLVTGVHTRGCSGAPQEEKSPSNPSHCPARGPMLPKCIRTCVPGES